MEILIPFFNTWPLDWTSWIQLIILLKMLNFYNLQLSLEKPVLLNFSDCSMPSQDCRSYIAYFSHVLWCNQLWRPVEFQRPTLLSSCWKNKYDFFQTDNSLILEKQWGESLQGLFQGLCNNQFIPSSVSQLSYKNHVEENLDFLKKKWIAQRCSVYVESLIVANTTSQIIQNLPAKEYLKEFLKVLKMQLWQSIIEYLEKQSFFINRKRIENSKSYACYKWTNKQRKKLFFKQSIKFKMRTEPFILWGRVLFKNECYEQNKQDTFL